MLSFCVLASSSSGNCIHVRSPSTSILIDAGISARETVRRLEQCGARIGDVRAVCLSHEHSDHTAGIAILHRRYGLPLFANAGTIEGAARDPRLAGLAWQVFTTGAPFMVGDLRIEPFSVPHDAYDPVGFVIEHGGARLGIATDLGSPTTLIRERLRTCHALVLEANHDEQMLQQSPRPWSLKQRILGRQGHLSNRLAAELLADIAGPALRHVVLAHLSQECNDPAVALREVRDMLRRGGFSGLDVGLAHADRIAATVDLGG